jgi:hypothetical protein
MLRPVVDVVVGEVTTLVVPADYRTVVVAYNVSKGEILTICAS